MLYQMRRTDRQTDTETALQILREGEYGVLATCGRDGYPYGVPVNYAFSENRIYFHCAPNTGLKQENLLFNPKVSFTVVGKTEVLSSSFSEQYESAIVFGTARKLSDEEDKKAALWKLIEKYSSDFKEKGRKYVDSSAGSTDVYEITVESITGKARR